MFQAFDNMSIRTKVIGAFAGVLLVTIALGWFAIVRMGAVDVAAEDVR